MDIYSFVFDTTVWSMLFTFITLFVYILILGLVTKSFFNKKWVMLLFVFSYFVISFIIHVKITNQIQQLFLKSDINSVVVLKANYAKGDGYRFKLKNGVNFLDGDDPDFKIEIGDSIVKEAMKDSIYIFRKDTSINDYVFLRSRKYYY